MIFTKKLFYASLSVLVFIGENALAYKSGCSGGYCFVVSEDKNDEIVTMQEAQQWCLSNRSQLVEITNKDIQNSLLSIIKKFGLNDGTYITNGKRSSNNWIRLSGENIGSINIHEQMDTSYAYGYLRLSTSGVDIFASRPEDLKDGYICSGVSDCANGATINGQCYKAYIEPLSWYDARNGCLDAGGDLASFDIITTNSGFNELDTPWLNRRHRYWIGIRREWWTWQRSNTDVKYSFWLIGQPTDKEDCLCLSRSQLPWFGCSCNQRYRFVCISGSEDHKLWITVGIGVGCFVIIAIVVVVVILILKRKRNPSKKDQRNITAPDLATNQGTDAIHPNNEATVYATVAKTLESKDNNRPNSKGFESNDKSQMVYVELQDLNS